MVECSGGRGPRVRQHATRDQAQPPSHAASVTSWVHGHRAGSSGGPAGARSGRPHRAARRWRRRSCSSARPPATSREPVRPSRPSRSDLHAATSPWRPSAHLEVAPGRGRHVLLGRHDPGVGAHQVAVSPGEAYGGAGQRGQQRVEGHQQLGIAEGRGDGDDEVGRTARQATPGGAGRGRAIGDGHALGEACLRVLGAGACVRSVVPGDGVAAVRDQAARGPGAVRELPVLPAVGGEGLVEPADLVVPPAAAREDGADDEAVAAAVGVQQVAAGGVRLAEPGRLGQLQRWRDLLDRTRRARCRRGRRAGGVPRPTPREGPRAGRPCAPRSAARARCRRRAAPAARRCSPRPPGCGRPPPGSRRRAAAPGAPPAGPRAPGATRRRRPPPRPAAASGAAVPRACGRARPAARSG